MLEIVTGLAETVHIVSGDTGPGVIPSSGLLLWNSFLFPQAFATVVAESSSSAGSDLEEGDGG